MARSNFRWLFILPFLALAGVAIGLPAAQSAALAPAELTAALQWRSVGPYVGGRTIAVSGVAQQPNVFFVGATGGGVWKSENYGATWRNISDGYFSNANIGAIAVAPSNPDVIYVGTGESDIRNTLLTGDGMYKSTDAGKTWKHVGLADTHIISWIVVDPNNPDVVYAAAMGHVWAPNAERGVFKSTDGGATWNKVLYVNDQTGAITLAMDPANPQVLYATMWQAYRRHWTMSSGGPGSGIYKTTDGGAHWTNITHNAGLPSGIFGKAGIAVAPSNPNVVYALIQAKTSNPAKPGGLFRSDNAGQTWAMVNDSSNITQRAFYYMRVYVNPKDPNTIYLPNVGVWESHDAGKTLIELHPPHGDNHAFWINPNNPEILIEGNDGGATVTQDGGKTWSQEHNQPTGQFYHVNLDNQFPFHIYGAQQDEGSTEGPSAVAAGGIPGTWTRIQGGESAWVVPQPGAPWITYASGYYSLLWREDRKTGLIQSINPTGDFAEGAAADELKYRFAWIHHPILFAPGNPQELLEGSQYVLKSMDHGQTWTEISPDLTRNDKSKQVRPGGPISADVSGAEAYETISSIAVSPLNDNVIWAGTDDGLVHVTTDGGVHWSAVHPAGLPEWITITCIEASHDAPGTAYLTASHYQWDDFKPYVYMTTDYGAHWIELAAGLPDNQYVESIRQDPNDPNLLFLGTSKTVFVSFDGGLHWSSLALNLPPVRVSDIAIQPDQHAVVLATHGRAFWVLDNLQFLEQAGKAQVAADEPYLFAPQQTWLVKRSSGGFFSAPDQGENLATGATVFFHLPANFNSHTPVKLSFTTASGALIRSFTLPVAPVKNLGVPDETLKSPPLHPGMNRFQWDLRYPNAVEVQGFWVPSPAGGDNATTIGPQVVPGTYYAVLDYNGRVSKQPFAVKLDPRLSTTQAELQARFDLLMQLHVALNTLDTRLNQAIDARDQLQKAVSSRQVSASRAQAALSALDNTMGQLVELRIQSAEGTLVYEPKLRTHLAYIADDTSLGFVAPTVAQQQAAAKRMAEARVGEASLQTAISQADALLRH
ncbi:MAG: WD40/YVTN/BNR-like repeat-containing protein [Gammaproteobacteria bacterium]